jgi:hypothetical protein
VNVQDEAEEQIVEIEGRSRQKMDSIMQEIEELREKLAQVPYLR